MENTMPKNDLVMDPKKLKKMRPDLYPEFLNILKRESPDHYHLIIDSPEIDEVLDMFEAKMTIQVCELPQNAQALIYKAMNEAIERKKKNEQK